MEGLKQILPKLNMGSMSEAYTKMSERDYVQFQVDSINEAVGNRDAQDGYDCRICKNKGQVAFVKQMKDGSYTYSCRDCKCIPTRKSILKMQQSGLKDIIKSYTFEKWDDSEPWQKALKDAAVEYAKDPQGWFFLGGQSGAGKTHLCTAICRQFLLEGRNVLYMLWRDDVVKLKSLVNNAEEYGRLIDTFKRVDVLYIDDLFKTGKTADQSVQMPTQADVNAAFEIINFRYNNPGLITIISSELTVDELIAIDEATAGRIHERAKAINIARDRSRNYRFRNTVTL